MPSTVIPPPPSRTYSLLRCARSSILCMRLNHCPFSPASLTTFMRGLFRASASLSLCSLNDFWFVRDSPTRVCAMFDVTRRSSFSALPAAATVVVRLRRRRRPLLRSFVCSPLSQFSVGRRQRQRRSSFHQPNGLGLESPAAAAATAVRTAPRPPSGLRAAAGAGASRRRGYIEGEEEEEGGKEGGEG